MSLADIKAQLIRIESALCDTRPKQSVGEMVQYAISLCEQESVNRELTIRDRLALDLAESVLRHESFIEEADILQKYVALVRSREAS
jgi:hypothetical protein